MTNLRTPVDQYEHAHPLRRTPARAAYLHVPCHRRMHCDRWADGSINLTCGRCKQLFQLHEDNPLPDEIKEVNRE